MHPIVRRGTLPLLALLLLLAAPAAAQEIRGRVVEGATMRGVEAAIVSLVDAGDETVSRVQSDRAGTFVLRAPGPGAYRVKTERVGYAAALSSVVDLADGVTSQLMVRLTPDAVRVDAVTVTASQQAPQLRGLDRNGFYDRQRVGTGLFLDRERIEKRNAMRTTQLLGGLPGISLEQAQRPGSSIIYTVVRITRSTLNTMEGSQCTPTVWMDGARLGQVERLDEVVNPAEIEGLEIYRGGSETPPQYGGTNAACGVIVIWSRSSA